MDFQADASIVKEGWNSATARSSITWGTVDSDGFSVFNGML